MRFRIRKVAKGVGSFVKKKYRENREVAEKRRYNKGSGHYTEYKNGKSKVY